MKGASLYLYSNIFEYNLCVQCNRLIIYYDYSYEYLIVNVLINSYESFIILQNVMSTFSRGHLFFISSGGFIRYRVFRKIVFYQNLLHSPPAPTSLCKIPSMLSKQWECTVTAIGW